MNTYDQIGKFGWLSLLSGATGLGNGHTYFVDGNSGNAANNSGAGQGASWDAPFSTINYAISRCSNNADDVILVAQDHTETISDTSATNTSGTTTDEFCVDKTGITIIGLGSNDRRPKISLTSATDACIDIRSPQCTLYNLWFYNNIAANVAMIDAQAAADGLTIENCRFDMASSATDPILMVNLIANCDDVTIRGCKFYAAASNDATLAAVKLEGGSDRLRLVDNVFVGDWNEQVIDADTAASTEVEVTGNLFYNVDAGVSNAIDFHSGTTGFVADNVVYCPVTGSGGGPIVAAACVKANNRITYDLVELADADGAKSSGLHANYYVDSGTGVSTNDGTSWGAAIDTIDHAVALCTAANGDTIHVAAGHEETLSDTVFIDLDVEGITVLGYGNGSNKPLITYDHADGEVIIGASNVAIKNLRFRPSANAVTNAIIFDDNMLNCHIENCEFGFPESATDEFATAIVTGDATNNITIENCKFMGGAQAAVAAINLTKDTDHTTIRNCVFSGAYSTAPILAASTASTNLDIDSNLFICTGSTDTFNLVAASTGVVRNNDIVMNAANAAAALDVGNCWLFGNRLIADDDTGGAKAAILDNAFGTVTATADDA